jgi:hypothetical protein
MSKSSVHGDKTSRLIKVEVRDELRRRAEHAKVDHGFDWTTLISRALERYLDYIDSIAREDSLRLIAETLGSDPDESAEEEA